MQPAVLQQEKINTYYGHLHNLSITFNPTRARQSMQRKDTIETYAQKREVYHHPTCHLPASYFRDHRAFTSRHRIKNQHGHGVGCRRVQKEKYEEHTSHLPCWRTTKTGLIMDRTKFNDCFPLSSSQSSQRQRTAKCEIGLLFGGFFFAERWSKSVHGWMDNKSPRWTINSGSPRRLLVLVREFESRRGEIMNLFAKKKDQLLRAPSVGKHNSTRVDKGRAEIYIYIYTYLVPGI